MNVQGPNGAVVAFPDGTDPSTIDQVMRQNFSSPSAKDDPDQLGALGSILDAAQAKSNADPIGSTIAGAKAIGSTANEIANSVSRGVPFSDRISAGLQTGLNAVAPGLGNGQDYAQNLAAERAQAADALKQNPVGERVGNFVGASALPFVGASGAMQGATLGAKMEMGAVGGGAIGAVQGASSTPDLTDPKQAAWDTGVGAGLGVLVGGGIPLVGAGIGAGAQKLYSKANPAVGDISAPAQAYVDKALAADGPAAVQARLDQLGPHGMLADAGPNLQGIAQGVVLKPGDARSIVTGALKDRAAGMNARVGADVDAALGPAGATPQAATDALQAQREALHASSLPQIYANAPPVDTSGVLSTIGQRLTTAVGPEQAALMKARDYLMTATADGSPIPVSNAQTLANAKSALDTLIKYGDPSLGVPPGALATAQGSLSQVRGQLNDALRTQVPGYSAIMDQSSALARQMEGIESGTQSLRSGTAAIHPDDFASQYGALPAGPVQPGSLPPRLPEQAATNLGMRGTVDRALGSKANDLQAVKNLLQGENGWNAQNIGTAFGHDAQSALEGTVNRETGFADTANKVIENSQSAQRLAMAKALADADQKPLLHLPLHDVTGHGMILGTGQAAINRIADLIRGPVDNAGRDADLARLISARGSEGQRMLTEALTNLQIGKQAAATGNLAGNKAALAAALVPNAALAYGRHPSQ